MHLACINKILKCDCDTGGENVPRLSLTATRRTLLLGHIAPSRRRRHASSATHMAHSEEARSDGACEAPWLCEGKPNGAMDHYEGEPGAVQLVRSERPDGGAQHYEGERGAERLVREEHPDGLVQYHEDALGAEREVRTECPTAVVLHEGMKDAVRTELLDCLTQCLTRHCLTQFLTRLSEGELQGCPTRLSEEVVRECFTFVPSECCEAALAQIFGWRGRETRRAARHLAARLQVGIAQAEAQAELAERLRQREARKASNEVKATSKSGRRARAARGRARHTNEHSSDVPSQMTAEAAAVARTAADAARTERLRKHDEHVARAQAK
jgi:hypothetical protein